MKKNGSTQLKVDQAVGRAPAPVDVYPEHTPRVIPAGPITKAPPSTVFCFGQLCLEIKYNLPYYLRKCDLMRYLRDQHDTWWANYTQLYERDAYTYPTTRTSQGWDYTNAAKEMLSRCKLFDSLFTQILKIDLAHVDEFGIYCKLVFLEINKLKPAFPDTPCSQSVFETSVRDVMKYVLRQAPPGYAPDLSEFENAIPRRSPVARSFSGAPGGRMRPNVK